MSNIPLSELIVSFQGEGIKVGLPTIFLRTSGCNFAIEGHPCSYCDTPYAWKVENPLPSDWLLEQVENMILRTGIKEICLTGGEPLMVPGIRDIIHYLGKRYNLTIETNGSYPIWKNECAWSLDIKCPSSGNEGYNNYDNLQLLTYKDQVKFVIGTREDFDFARDITNSRIVLTNVIFQPVWKGLNPKELATWILEEKLSKVILGLQLHKIIWGKQRGK